MARVILATPIAFRGISAVQVAHIHREQLDDGRTEYALIVCTDGEEPRRYMHETEIGARLNMDRLAGWPQRARIETVTGPVSFASYFINGDASGLDETERQWADDWKRHHAVVNVVGIEEDSERFTWQHKLYAPGMPYTGGDVCDFYCELAPAPAVDA